jgi:hypothetical protein
MKTPFHVVIMVTIIAILAGCGATTREIARMAQSVKEDVFTEVQAEGTVPANLSYLLVKTSIKTPLEGYYVLESKASMHGKPGYPFLLNIDGQAVLWEVEGRKETIPRYDEKGKTSRDPDAGVGIKYSLEKRVELAPGIHKVFLALPGEDYFIEADISVKAGVHAVLEFRPVYRYKTYPTRIRTFLKGIKQYEVYLNGARFENARDRT